jgi:hypothetical protein
MDVRARMRIARITGVEASVSAPHDVDEVHARIVVRSCPTVIRELA